MALIGEGIAAAMFKPRSLAISGAVRHWLRKPLAWWSTSDTDHLQAAQLSGVAAAIATCLLYTSDAADERSSVDLGGRRIIKKKKNQTQR